MSTDVRTRRFTSRAELDAALVERLARAISGTPSGVTERSARESPGGASAGSVSSGNTGGSAIMLSGGKTPLPAYRELGRLQPHHRDNLKILYSDDRYVPPTDENSNYFQSRPLIEALKLPDSAVHRVRTQLPLEEAARDYERQLADLTRSGIRVGLGLLGLGADGHTASLFRPEHLQQGRGHLAIPVQRPDGMSGISVTPEFLSQVEQILFVVAGGGKYDVIQRFMRQDPTLVALQAVQGCPNVELWVDQEAASSLMA